MVHFKKRVSTVIAGAVVAGGLMFGGATAAQAATANMSVGPFSTVSECEAAKVTYISSWTKISQGCTYYPQQGGFTDNGYYFHYRAIA
ncbi:hypothetical protein C5E07_02880 [Pseudoclavibacter sp. RFBJ3]|uniref:hypothetical protein n=1 Tax=unclassified Pseudoclavibacter TaxID=2615177 RepID=UPI000CE879FA|nr:MULTISPECIES: hypothetical protein [unclassified Pseudoclavibacter]PPF80864.1 hypothetical protein C5C12_16330 [Pseudoclavibacter sp. RFBJ5]PPF94373.1 hypothetical protein C5E07_02880 [Pseudoclavibacter sp. RFBJ3]PPF99480.1 hypothetical protein C5C19_04515 [Pseudoclavibacter sp. RFBH5]PPG04680.1 hypothetical protein C5E06_04440 [Pseudoclavibacter sp. RFBI5]PPG25674.1 hypothetical protein C5E13_01580 [Pseudoclavibacter sp. RFBI4]